MTYEQATHCLNKLLNFLHYMDMVVIMYPVLLYVQ